MTIKKYNKTLTNEFKSMRQFGIGARYGSDWMVQDFLKMGVACIGFDKDDAPEIFAQFRTVERGDIIFMKAYGPSSAQMCIMGIGFVKTNKLFHVNDELGWGKKVEWIMKDELYLLNKFGKDKHRNVRLGTLYEEFHPQIKRIIGELLAEKVAA